MFNYLPVTFRLFFLFLFSAFSSAKTWSQIPVSAIGTSYTEDFSALENMGTSSVLPNGWMLLETGTNANTTYSAGTGSGNAGDTYSFGVAGSSERALGTLLSGSLIPTIGSQFVNTTGTVINALQITYTGEQWRMGTAGRADRLDFQYSLDATSLATGTWTDVDALDFSSPVTTGSVGALVGNNAANQSTISFTITGLNIENGATFYIRWQDFNASGSDDGLAIDDFSITPFGRDDLVVLSISDASFTEGNSGTNTATFSVSLSRPAEEEVIFDIATQEGTAVAGADFVAKTLVRQVIPTGSTSYTFDVSILGDVEFEPDETFFVNITNIQGALAGKAQAIGTILNDDSEPLTITFIHEVQGAGMVSPFANQTRTIEGIVVSNFQSPGQLAGFNVQEEMSDYDTDPLTSEGIFVLSPIPVQVGDKVQVKGMVQENFGLTRITATSVDILSSNNDLPAVTPVIIPEAIPEGSTAFLERYEGMLVAFNQPLTVTGNYNLERYGEVVLSAYGRLIQPTNFIDPTDIPASGTANNQNNVAAVITQQTINSHRSIILDDLSDGTLQAPTTIPYLDSTTNTLRVGSTVTNLTGILDYGFNFYRIRPTAAPSFVYAPRPEVPSVGNADVRIASFNVLNYFVTFGGANDRGANNPEEFIRQKAKIVEAISQLNADIIGLIEIQNNGDGETSAIADLVNALNAKAGTARYAYIKDPATGTGSDVIKNAILYKPSVVTPQGASLSDTDAIYNRYPVAQIFMLNKNGEVFTFIVNHFKSKGSGSGPNADQGDGQGASNLTRRQQAEALLGFIDELKSIDPDILSVGDYNAYIQEDPMDILAAGGLINLINEVDAYSYNFSNQSGSLDHALVTASLNTQVTGAAKWHINADEPAVIDYNFENSFFPYDPKIQDLYAPTPYRSSDHDPVLVGLKLQNPLIRFTEAAATIEEKSGEYRVRLALSKPKFQNEEVTVTIQTQAKYGLNGKGDYVTNPNGASGSFILPVPAGDTSIAFTVIPDKNAAKKKANKVITFRITETSSGLTMGEPNAFTLTITDDKKKETLKDLIFAVWPNPTQGLITIGANLKEIINQPIQVTLRSEIGTVLYSGEGTVDEMGRQVSERLLKAKRGFYYIQVEFEGKQSIIRLFKM